MDGIKIDGQIFMGSGEHTAEMIKKLNRNLNEALIILSGIQQPPTCHESAEVHKEWPNEIVKGNEKILALAKEIFLGLTGKEAKVD